MLLSMYHSLQCGCWVILSSTNWCLTAPPGSTFLVWLPPDRIKPRAPSVMPYGIKSSRITAVSQNSWTLLVMSLKTKHVTLQSRFQTPPNGTSIVELTRILQNASHRTCSPVLYHRGGGLLYSNSYGLSSQMLLQ